MTDVTHHIDGCPFAFTQSGHWLPEDGFEYRYQYGDQELVVVWVERFGETFRHCTNGDGWVSRPDRNKFTKHPAPEITYDRTGKYGGLRLEANGRPHRNLRWSMLQDRYGLMPDEVGYSR